MRAVRKSMSKDYLASVDKAAKAELKVGGRTCQCAGCGHFFTGASSFDRHQIESERGELTCRTPTQMRAIGMAANEHGVWQGGVSKKRLEDEKADERRLEGR